MINYFKWGMHIFAILFCILNLTGSAEAQKQMYPNDYYQFPIRPGLSNSLAGVLGDLRTNHFHAGLDIRTEQREGLPVFAAAEGYVSKVAVQRSGYGNVIYLLHPNGQTTVYGHLLQFSSPLAEYVREAQYEKQSFEIDLIPEPGRFKFNKGEIIALSGNTGGSGGPHLHFEIRDARNNYLNPLFFGFKEIKDVTPPKFVGLAIRPMDINGRVNQQYDRKGFTPVLQKDGTYAIAEPISAKGLIGMELLAHDMMTGTAFRYGLQCIEIRVDGHEIFSYNMEVLPNASTRDYNNLIDYAREQETGQRFLKCYVPDGNVFNLYKTGFFNGKLNISDTLSHHISIRITDSFENASVLNFVVQGESEKESHIYNDVEITPESIQLAIEENVLKVTANRYKSSDPKGIFYAGEKQIIQAPDYYVKESAIFLVDIRNTKIDSVQVGSTVVPTHLRKKVISGVLTDYQEPEWNISFSESSLFDTLYVYGKQSGATLSINQGGVALKNFVTISWLHDPMPLKQAQSHIYRKVNGQYRFVGGKWSTDRITFQTRELGDFEVRTDTVGPNIRLLEKSKRQIRAYISDATSGIDSYKADVDGNWVLMNFDAKTGYIWSEKLAQDVDFAGDLTLTVTDRAGNNTILHTKIEEIVVKPKKVVPATKKTAVSKKKAAVPTKKPKRK
jgi:hypothetical protein